MWHDNPFDPWEERDDGFCPRWICFGKGGGGGGQTRTVNQGGLPDYAEPYYKRLMERAEAESQQEYVPYQGQRLTDFGEDTQSAFSEIRDVAAQGENPYVTASGEAYGRTAGYETGGPFITGQWDEDAAGRYMNPYVSNVLDRNRARAQRAFQEADVQRQADFARRGAFSSSRRDIASETARSDLNEQLLDIEAKGMADAYRQAGQLYTSDQQRALQAQIESERAAQGAEGLRTQAAQGLAGLGQLSQQQALQRADALGRIGGLQEERDQAALDLAYSDFVNQRDYNRQALNWYAGLMHGVPIAATSESTTYQRQPGQFQQLAGLGLGGLSLYNQFLQGARTTGT